MFTNVLFLPTQDSFLSSLWLDDTKPVAHFKRWVDIKEKSDKSLGLQPAQQIQTSNNF